MAIFDRTEWRTLVAKLLRGTKEGTLQWAEVVQWPSDYYLLKISDSVSYKLSSKDNDGVFPYKLEILQASDRVLDSYVSQPYAVAFRATVDEMLDLLHTAIERQVSGAVELHADLMKELNDLVGDDPSDHEDEDSF